MTDWFEEFEGYPIVNKSQIKWSFTKDFQVQSKFIVEHLKSISSNLEIASDQELLSASQSCHSLISWTKQMAIMGFSGFQEYMDRLLLDNFDDNYIIQSLRSRTFNKWMANNEGYQKIGENYFTLQRGRIFYKKLDNSWYLVELESVFDIMPSMELVDDDDLVLSLNSSYKPTVYKQIYDEWGKSNYSNPVPVNHYSYHEGESDPDNELAKAVTKINNIIEAPVSLLAILDISSLDLNDIEFLIKHSFVMAKFVQERRNKNEHTIYLLRDCIIFNEIHETLDAIEQRATSSDRLIVCRDLLSNKKRRGGHWYFSQEALFFAYEKYPNDFDNFYREYSHILKDYEEYSDEFSTFIKKISLYVDEHIPENIDHKVNIDIVDLGFQGSINMLLKYVIDRHCTAGKKNNTGIHMTVLAEWFKSTYKGMYSSETYSILTSIESLARNELMYRYKLGSFEEGSISVIMGSSDEQKQANTELLVTTMVTIISKDLKLI
jgi:hypothetical protein